MKGLRWPQSEPLLIPRLKGATAVLVTMFPLVDPQSTPTISLSLGLYVPREHWEQLHIQPTTQRGFAMDGLGTVTSTISQSHKSCHSHVQSRLSHIQAYILCLLLHMNTEWHPMSPTLNSHTPQKNSPCEYPDLESHTFRVIVGLWLQKGLTLVLSWASFFTLDSGCLPPDSSWHAPGSSHGLSIPPLLSHCTLHRWRHVSSLRPSPWRHPDDLP